MTKRFHVNRDWNNAIQKWNGFMIVSNFRDYFACVFLPIPGYYIGIPLGWDNSKGWFPVEGNTIRIETFEID